MMPSQEYARGWLRAFFDGEGGPRMQTYLCLEHGKRYPKVCAEIKAVNTDWSLISRAKRYLKNFAIVFRVSFRPAKKKTKAVWGIHIIRQSEILRFAQSIGFTSPKKKEKLQRMVDYINRPRRSFPWKPKELHDLYINKNLSSVEISRKTFGNPGNSSYVCKILREFDIPVRTRAGASRLAWRNGKRS